MESNIISKNIDFYFVALLFAMVSIEKNILVSLTIAGALFGIYLLIRDWRFYFTELKNNRYLYLSLAFLIPMTIAMIDTLYPDKKYKPINTMFVYVILGVLPIFMVRYQGNFKRLQLLVVLGILYISADAIVQSLTDYHTYGYSPVEGTRVRGMLWGYHLSYFLATFSPILLFFFYQKFEKKPTLLNACVGIIGLLVFVVGIMLGGARAGMLSLIVSIFLFLVFLFYSNRVKHKLRFLGVCFLILIVFLGIISLIPEVQLRFKETVPALDSGHFFKTFTSLRPNIWHVAFSEIPNYLINGVGVRGFNNLYQTYPADYKIFIFVDHPHLHGLEVLIETGLIGFIPYLGICLYLLIRMFKAKAGNMWLMMGFVALMPINSHVPVYQNYWLPLEWVPIMLGLALAYNADKKAKKQTLVNNSVSAEAL